MMNSELLKEAIEEAKALKQLVLSWREGQFSGTCDWDNAQLGTTKRVSCYCGYCRQSISLESSSSHAQICRCPISASYIVNYDTQQSRSYVTKVQEDGTEKFDHWEPPSFCAELEKRIKEGKFGKVDKYTWG